MVVADIEAARAELVGRGIDVRGRDVFVGGAARMEVEEIIHLR